MSTFLTDTFTDTAGVALESHTGETGATWAKSAAAGLTTSSQITASGTVRPATNAGISCYIASGIPASADYDVTGTLAVKSLIANTYAGVIGRVQAGAAAYFYGATYQHGTGYFLFKQVNGAYTQIGTVDAVTAADGDTLTLRLRGSAISLLVNGTQVATLTDTSVSGAGSAGTFLYAPSTPTDTTGIHLTSISAAIPVSAALAAGSINVTSGTPASSALSVAAATAPTGGTVPYTTLLQRSFDAGTTWHAADNGGSLPYTDTGLPRSTALTYRAIVTDSAGAAGVTASVSTTTAAASGTQTALVVCGIDSITHGFGASTDTNAGDTNPGATTGSNYPARLTALLGDGWDVRNVGVNGQSITAAQSANREGAFFSTGTYTAGQVLVLFGGINDLRNGASAATAYASLKAYVTARKAAGWRVVICTLHDVIDPASSFTSSLKDAFNVLVRAGWQYDLKADALADVGADNRIGVDGAASRASYANYYTTLDTPKHEHLNDRGYEILASIVATAVGQAMGNVAYLDPGASSVASGVAFGPSGAEVGTYVGGTGSGGLAILGNADAVVLADSQSLMTAIGTAAAAASEGSGIAVTGTSVLAVGGRAN